MAYDDLAILTEGLELGSGASGPGSFTVQIGHEVRTIEDPGDQGN